MILFVLVFQSKDETRSETGPCFTLDEKEGMIEAILMHENVKKYLHLEKENRTPIKLKASKIVTKDLNIILNKQSVLVTDDIALKDLIVLRFEEIKCEEKKVSFSIFLKMENAHIEVA